MKKLALILVFLVVGLCFVGCDNQKIQFNRDSKFSEVMKNFQIQTDKPTVKKSSGVIIYRDEPQKKQQQQPSAGFGPGDITFNIMK